MGKYEPHRYLDVRYVYSILDYCVFTFKLASTIIRETRTLVIDQVTSGLDIETLNGFRSFRNTFGNDAQMIRFLRYSALNGLNPETTASLITEIYAKTNDKFELNGDGTIKFTNNSKVHLGS